VGDAEVDGAEVGDAEVRGAEGRSREGRAGVRMLTALLLIIKTKLIVSYMREPRRPNGYSAPDREQSGPLDC
jgi:hypothetical protein